MSIVVQRLDLMETVIGYKINDNLSAQGGAVHDIIPLNMLFI